MKRYYTLNNNIDWYSVILKLNPKAYTLLDNNKGDYTFAWGIENFIQQKKYSKHLLNRFQKQNSCAYIFGYTGFDAKNSFFKDLESKNTDKTNLDESIFYIPKHVIIQKNGTLVYYGDEEGYHSLFDLTAVKQTKSHHKSILKLEIETSKKEYLAATSIVKKHLQNGNIYEMNYCINFSKNNIDLDILSTFLKLKDKTKAPFSSLFRFNNTVILSGSPERFFLKHDSQIVSQPIKGTSARGNTIAKDELLKQKLLGNQKEISENIMIVDLVRNDLSKIAKKNSVAVSELCKLYSFETVHQLISTVNARIDSETSFESILENLFPMGSMTGAPKLKSLQYIEALESFKRNIYSGAVGCITPNNNMDFNVVIRSIVYNSEIKKLSVSVGSAITIHSELDKEYEECLLKLKAVQGSITKR